METLNLKDENGGAVEFHIPSTCLDRAQIALSQTGQVHCAMMMDLLQEMIIELSRVLCIDYKNNPAAVVRAAVALIEQEGLC